MRCCFPTYCSFPSSAGIHSRIHNGRCQPAKPDRLGAKDRERRTIAGSTNLKMASTRSANCMCQSPRLAFTKHCLEAGIGETPRSGPFGHESEVDVDLKTVDFCRLLFLFPLFQPIRSFDRQLGAIPFIRLQQQANCGNQPAEATNTLFITNNGPFTRSSRPG